MPKEGDAAVMYCSKCKVSTPHTYKSSFVGDLSKKILGKNLKDIGSGWYCNNCGKKSAPDDLSDNIEDFNIEDISDDSASHEDYANSEGEYYDEY